jgi:hypothetical protein
MSDQDANQFGLILRAMVMKIEAHRNVQEAKRLFYEAGRLHGATETQLDAAWEALKEKAVKMHDAEHPR